MLQNEAQVGRILVCWHVTSKVDDVADRVALLKEVEGDGADVAVLVINPLLRANLLQSLHILEDGIDDLFDIGEAFLSQGDAHSKVGEAFKLVIATG